MTTKRYQIDICLLQTLNPEVTEDMSPEDIRELIIEGLEEVVGPLVEPNEAVVVREVEQ